MAATIRIKRSTGSTAPSSLTNAELAYAEGSNRLYIGTGSGGSAAVTQIADASLFSTQAAGYVYAAPGDSSGVAAFRALVSSDIPSGIAQTKVGSTLGGSTLSDDISYLYNYKASTTHGSAHTSGGSDPISGLAQSQIASTLGGSFLSDDINYLNTNKVGASHTHAGTAVTIDVGNTDYFSDSDTVQSGFLVIETQFGNIYGAIGAVYTYVDTGLGGKASASHSSSHAAGGSDEITGLSQSQIESYLGGNVLSDDIDYLFQNKANVNHASTHDALGSDPIMLQGTQVLTNADTDFFTVDDSVMTALTALSNEMVGRATTTHTHGAISSDGKIGTTTGRIVVTGTGGALTTATIGSGLTLSNGTLSGGSGGTTVGSDIYLWSYFR